MQKVLFLMLILALSNFASCKDLFKADYSDFEMSKLMPLRDKQYTYELDKMCQSRYEIEDKEEICADFYYYWKGFKNERSK